ncbi:MAG: hypothetical protein ACI89W_002058, partial [Gammaproteobacteria bacterium]
NAPEFIPQPCINPILTSVFLVRLLGVMGMLVFIH